MSLKLVHIPALVVVLMSMKLKHRPASDEVIMSVMLMLCDADRTSPWRSSSHSFHVSVEHLLSSNSKGIRPPQKAHSCNVVLISDALLAALTSTSRRLLSQPSLSARLSEASQQAQHNPAATLQYLRRHLLVSTWHMPV